MKDDTSWLRGYSNPYGVYPVGSPAWMGKLTWETQNRAAPTQPLWVQTDAPKQAPAVYGRESVTDLNLSVWAEVGDAISRLCVLPFLFGVLYGADQNFEKQQFNPFVAAYNLSEDGFAMAWSVGDSAIVKVVVTLLCSPLVLSAAGGAVVGDTGISVLRVGTYLVTKASESWYR